MINLTRKYITIKCITKILFKVFIYSNFKKAKKIKVD